MAEESQLEYTKRLITNVKRLKEDAEFNLAHGRKLTSLFLYICAAEEIFKLEPESQKSKKIPSHRNKLIKINSKFDNAISKLENTDTLIDIMAHFVLEVISLALKQTKKEEELKKIKMLQEQIKGTKTSLEILQLVDTDGFIQPAIEELVRILERNYTDKVRNRCLYVDKNDEPLSESEIDAQIEVFKNLTSGYLETILIIEKQINEGNVKTVEVVLNYN